MIRLVSLELEISSTQFHFQKFPDLSLSWVLLRLLHSAVAFAAASAKLVLEQILMFCPGRNARTFFGQLFITTDFTKSGQHTLNECNKGASLAFCMTSEPGIHSFFFGLSCSEANFSSCLVPAIKAFPLLPAQILHVSTVKQFPGSLFVVKKSVSSLDGVIIHCLPRDNPMLRSAADRVPGYFSLTTLQPRPPSP